LSVLAFGAHSSKIMQEALEFLRFWHSSSTYLKQSDQTFHTC